MRLNMFSRSLATATGATRHWWAFALAAPILVGTVIVAAGLGVNAWFIGILCVFTGSALTAIGFGLGVVRLLPRPCPRRHSVKALLVTFVAVCTTITACGGSDTATKNRQPGAGVAREKTNAAFCEGMGHLIKLLAPKKVRISPAETEAASTETAGWFAHADRNAPAEIAAEFGSYRAAYDEYAHYLSTVGYNLDTVFSTRAGSDLAIATSHTITPAIVQYTETQCGLSFGDERHEPPTP
jgi:hypothetical protein